MRSDRQVDVSIVMPCLDDAAALGDCIAAARQTLDALGARHGFKGEIVVADSGSTDGGPEAAERLGARVLAVSERGYGAAVRAGLAAARGRYLVLGEPDGSLDFRDAATLVEALADGAGLCVGARRGARRNPVLSAAVNLLAGLRISDPQCGLRAVTRACLDRLDLKSAGADILSEMLVKAAVRREQVVEVAVAFHPAPPKSGAGRAWRGGRTHLSDLLILSPSWVFVLPAIVGGFCSLTVLAMAGWSDLQGRLATTTFGNYWVILASAMLALSHMAAILGTAGHIYGVREGYRRPSAIIVFLAARVTLETFLLAGAALFLAGLLVLALVAKSWADRHFGMTYSVYPVALGSLLLTLGAQTTLGGFLLAIVGGNQARFLQAAAAPRSARAPDAALAAKAGRPARQGRDLVQQHSFVVLAYKDSPFLGDCLRSLRAQTAAPNILIATSTPSPYIEAQAREHGVEVLVNPRREGIAGDWNFALEATRSRWVTLAHQDDVYYPRFLERTLELFDRSRAGPLCFTGYAEVDDDGRPTSSKISKVKHLIQLLALGSEEPIRGLRLRAMLAFGNTLPCSSVTYDRQRLGPFAFSQDFASNLDWDAWLRLAARGEVFLHTHERLIGRRHNPLTETSQLIKDGRRKAEDVMMFRRIWPRPVGDLIAQIYRVGY